MARAILLLVVLSAAFAQAIVPSTPTCTFGNLNFNPWDRWNLFAFNDIGTSANPMGADTEGRVAAGGSMYFDAFTLRAKSTGTSDTTPWSATAGGSFTLLGGDVKFGGVEAVGDVRVVHASVEGDVHSTTGTVYLGDANGAATVTGAVRGVDYQLLGGSSAAGGTFKSNGLSLSVDLNDVKAYFAAASLQFAGLSDSNGGADLSDPNDIKVTLNAGLNILTITQGQLETASRLILSGDATGILVINIAGVSGASLTNFDVYEDLAGVNKPSFGRVLINFFEATDLTFQLSGYVSLLAPLADAHYVSGVITGTVVVKSLTTEAGGSQINILPWTYCPENPPAPSPGVGQEVPSPPEECPPCPWEELGFNPWELWNVFSVADIGSSAVPFGSDFQGRLAAGGNVWLQTFSFHDIAQAATTAWSATVGGNFNLWGGSVSNGGVEAGGNVVITSADVAGDVHSVGGNAVIGGVGAAAQIDGVVRAAGTVTISGESSVLGHVQGDNSLSLSVDLVAVANWFKAQSIYYSNQADSTLAVVYDPDPVTPNDITVTLASGFNFLTLTSAQLQSASRLQLTGAADGVLVINVAGTTLSFDALDVYVDDWATVPAFGRVLINFYEATGLTVEWGSGHVSVLAPLANVLYKSGVFTGSWVVGSLVSQWTGGTQINVQPWTPPCPPCPPSEGNEVPSGRRQRAQQRKSFAQNVKATVKAQTKTQRKVAAQSARNVQQPFAQQQSQGIPQWAVVAGGLVAGVAMAALVVAGVAIRKLSNFQAQANRKARKPTGNNVPATPSNLLSPQSVTSSVSHRGRGQFPVSP